MRAEQTRRRVRIMAPDSTSPPTAPEAASDLGHTANHKVAAGLSLGALGVVFGDIGTSPLYAMRETFLHATACRSTPRAVLGVLSLIFWSLMIVGDGQVRHLDHARRQQGRGRHPGAGGAGHRTA